MEHTTDKPETRATFRDMQDGTAADWAIISKIGRASCRERVL